MERFCSRLTDCVSCTIKACYWSEKREGCQYHRNGTVILDQLNCPSGSADVTNLDLSRSTTTTSIQPFPALIELAPTITGFTVREMVLIVALVIMSLVVLVLATFLFLANRWRCRRGRTEHVEAARLIESSSDDSSSSFRSPIHASTPLARPPTTSASSVTNDEEEADNVSVTMVQATKTGHVNAIESDRANDDFEQVDLTPHNLRPRPTQTPQRFPKVM